MHMPWTARSTAGGFSVSFASGSVSQALLPQCLRLFSAIAQPEAKLMKKPPAVDLAVDKASESFKAFCCNYKLSQRGNPAVLRLAKSPSKSVTLMLYLILSAIFYFLMLNCCFISGVREAGQASHAWLLAFLEHIFQCKFLYFLQVVNS